MSSIRPPRNSDSEPNTAGVSIEIRGASAQHRRPARGSSGVGAGAGHVRCRCPWNARFARLRRRRQLCSDWDAGVLGTVRAEEELPATRMPTEKDDGDDQIALFKHRDTDFDVRVRARVVAEATPGVTPSNSFYGEQ